MIFIDTNVLIYAAGLAAEHDPRIATAREILDREEPFVISAQVLQEFYVTATTPSKLRGSLSPREARDSISFWNVASIIPMTIELFNQATILEGRYQYHFWDCAILAAARFAGCDMLMSEDMHHGHDVGGVTITNPFLPAA